MRKFSRHLPLILSGLLSILTFSCSKETPDSLAPFTSESDNGSTYRSDAQSSATTASVNTGTITNTKSYQATCTKNKVTVKGTGTITTGVCWSTSPKPVLTPATDKKNNNFTNDAAAKDGTYNSTIPNLAPKTTYYLRAYVTVTDAYNKTSTYYGNPISFTTPNPFEVSYSPVTITDLTYATCEGTIIYNDDPITEKGICWRPATPITWTSMKDTKSTKAQSISCKIEDLLPGRTYYFKAYVKMNNYYYYYDKEQAFKPAMKYKNVTYHILTIGKQFWMVENFKATKYRNDADIKTYEKNPDGWKNSNKGACCPYNDDNSKATNYGMLYNARAVNDVNFCPDGWCVPSVDDFVSLMKNMPNTSTAPGGQMKSLNYWTSPNSGATNASFFTALPGGIRKSDASFDLITKNCYLWSSSIEDMKAPQDDGTYKYQTSFCLSYNTDQITSKITKVNENFGYSVRLVSTEVLP